jgi:hypothetical protein
MNGVQRIRAERARQKRRDGEHYNAAHDKQHRNGELAMAAAFYATPPELRDRSIERLFWPGSHWRYKPNADRVRELEKAGALIAAEIDRLLAARDGDTT